MDNVFSIAGELAATAKEYMNARIESAKLLVAEKSSAVIAGLVAGAILVVVFFGFLVFTGIAVAMALGQYTGRPWLGFLAVAFLYLLTGVLIWKLKEKLIRRPVMNAMLRQLTSNEEEQ